MCAKRGHLAAVKKIVEHGSPVLCTDNNGWTPRVAAEKVGHTDVSSFLTNEERCADR
ncbi:hypothetical protein CAOG_009466 [Capsaspora owczarzaki ATCC 30864]|uniref:Uncharacterized protein n=1 Tax=Capsaspora owczarzaki (strain ATCC 30864) TaxID=595528 RepID=A0A0D2VKI4_CAPO3|nr:hypothetical protein CAOG_009466 [Capsaspora owczarzaki ATCC 30864]